MEQRPLLSIDMRWSRIRIHKKTLHMIGDPDYIQLLVNPQKRSVAIRAGSPRDHLSLRMRWKEIARTNCCELHSKVLLTELKKVCADLDLNQTYRISGVLVPSVGVACFCMDDAQPIASFETEEE